MIYQIYVGNLTVGTFTDKIKMKKALRHLTNYTNGTPLIDSVGWRIYKIDNSAKSAVTNLRKFEHDKEHLEKINQSFR